MKLNGTHELLVCTEDVHLFGKHIYNVKQNSGVVEGTPYIRAVMSLKIKSLIFQGTVNT